MDAEDTALKNIAYSKATCKRESFAIFDEYFKCVLRGSKHVASGHGV
jgi:hypothetical protein